MKRRRPTTRDFVAAIAALEERDDLMKQFRRNDTNQSRYGGPRNPSGIRTHSVPKLKLGPTLTEARRTFTKRFFDK